MAMIEALVAMVIIGVMLAAAMRTVAASRVGQVWNSDRLKGHALAMDLMGEILDQAYVDPGALPLFGPEVSELLAGRSVYNDVDDYNGWSESPPAQRDGTLIPGLTGWKRQVDVAWVTAADVTQTSLVETGIKRIVITVAKNGKTVAKVTALRTAAAPR
jgi:type II secretory pathway pseudopilin PulG